MMKRLFGLIPLLLLGLTAHAADVAISALPAASALGGTEVAPVVQSATTKKATAAQIAAYVQSVYPALTNTFFTIAGPASSTKTFTLPNASATILTDNAAVTVPQGGTGVGTLTGLVLGNGVSAFSAYAGTSCTNQFIRSLSAAGVATCNTVSLTGDVTNTLGVTNGGNGLATATLGDLRYGSGTNTLAALAGNTTSVKQFLTQTGNGTISAAPVWNSIQLADLPAIGANPSALVGLTAVNGAASTAMRSDGAPALDQSIVPSWTGLHTFAKVGSNGTNTVAQATVSTCPIVGIENTGGAADAKWWTFDACGTTAINFRAVNDAGSTGVNWLSVARSGAAVTSLTFGNATNNPTYTFNGTGATNFNGTVTVPTTSALSAGRISPTGSAVPACGFYLPATNNMANTCALSNAGTKFTTSGCSVSATTGGSQAGTFTLGANSCTVVVTILGATGSAAPNGWTCQAHDRTAPTVLLGGESSSTTTTASFTIPVTAGATDVISFSCLGF